MDKIDIHNTEENYSEAIDLLKKDVSPHNYKLIHQYLEDSAIGKTARKNARKKQVGLRARLKNLYLLKIASSYFNKDLDKINSKDMEAFIRALNENKLKKSNKEPYSEQTKSNLKITFINFLRYNIKDSGKFSELTDWVDTNFKKKEIPALNEEEIKKILRVCFTTQQKALICILFDSGCRIEELLNVRLSDVTEVKASIPYYKLLIRTEFSKTQGRNISLFWKPTTEILKQYLEEHLNKETNSTLFETTYDGVRKLLAKLGKRALGRSVNAHLFRHSSATYYAGLGTDYFQLCKRYGWTIGSNMPRVYIDRSGVNEKEMQEKFINTNIKDITEQLEIEKRERNKIQEELREIKELWLKIEAKAK